jgi:tRNA1Val (adenine37-N6)-methyltransferase
LLDVIQQLLATPGTAWILLPLEEANSCISQAANFGLTLKRHVLIRTSKQHSPHVAMIALEHQQIDNQNNAEVPTEIFTVYTQHPYLSDESAALFRDYYTKIKQA